MSGLRFLVITVVHHPYDTRVLYREIQALLDAGHAVTYAAAFTARGVVPPDGVVPIDLPAARGRHRVAAWRAARTVIRTQASAHDAVLIHDPELLTCVRGSTAPIVWDVHEDTAAAVRHKGWIPAPVRGGIPAAFRAVERWAERHHRLILAEASYQQRFSAAWPVIPNSTWIPPIAAESLPGRAVVVSSMTRVRGVHELIEVGRLVREHGIALDLIGSADDSCRDALESATRRGDVRWHGFLPSREALSKVAGATAGLSLLHDTPNYRGSQPTKVVEYMAHGVPVVSTPLPHARDLIESTGAGVVVPFADPHAAAAAVISLNGDHALRQEMGAAGRSAAAERYNWLDVAPAFVSVLQETARSGSRSARASGRRTARSDRTPPASASA